MWRLLPANLNMEYESMVSDLQKAGIWKRFAAWMFDFILAGMLAVGLGFLLSSALGYNGYSEALDRTYAQYESEYGITFEITQSDYQAMSEAQRQNYDAAYRALTADQDAIYLYNMILHLTLLITTLGILLAILIWEFFVPLLLGNGQTLGKKIFSLCLMRTDGVKVNNLQLFTRAILGKFTIETMIPVYILLMIFLNSMGLAGTLILLGLLIAQAVSLAVTHTNAALHDLLAGTVVVDSASQTIFPTAEARLEYQKKVAAERAARQTY